MTDISFLMPSRTRDRDPKDFAHRVIDNINSIVSKSKYSHEILTFSESPIEGTNVTWYEEKSLVDGCVGGYNALIKHANGKYLVQSGDDYTFDEQFHTAIDLLEGSTYKNRHLKLLALGSDNGLGSFMPQGFPKYGVFRYPIVSKDTVMNLMNGAMFHPWFKNHYADNWLGYWVNMMFDETMVEVWNTTIHIGPPTSYNHNNGPDYTAFRTLVDNFHKGERRYAY